jgi:membrane fusion protein (multidrug efflux system)
VKITFKPEDLKKYAGRLAPGMSTVVEIDLRQKQPQTQTAAAK